MSRRLDDNFISALLSGALSPILRCVHNDQTLDMEIREDEIHVYYRGGRLLRCQKNDSAYIFSFDKNYCKNSVMPFFPERVYESSDSDKIVAVIPHLKQSVDYYFCEKKDTAEREFQQLIVRENNYSGISNSTDYFIVDIEYANAAIGARFDLVAIKWLSDAQKRKQTGLAKCPPKLALIEMKYAGDAIDGSAGIKKHVEDVVQFFENGKNVSLFKSEVVDMFEQKRKLSLIRFGPQDNHNSIARLNDEKPEFILLFANYDPASSKLQRALEEVGKMTINTIDLKIATSNFMGYGFYDEAIYSLHDFLNKFYRQIFRKS